MAEYIKRAYVMEQITASKTQAELKQLDGCAAYNRVLEIINAAPAADVVPVETAKQLIRERSDALVADGHPMAAWVLLAAVDILDNMRASDKEDEK